MSGLTLTNPSGTISVVTGGTPQIQQAPPAQPLVTLTQVLPQTSVTPDIINWNDIQGKPNFGTASLRDVPAAGDASLIQVVLGSDTRMTGPRQTNSTLITDATVVGKALLTAVSQFAARGSLGFSALGETIVTAANPLAVRNAIGLGTIATQNSNAVTITGGTITGITDLAVADGGTGASTAGAARTNLGSGATGDALFVANTAAVARPLVGLLATAPSTLGNNLLIASDVAAALALLSVPAQPTYRNFCYNGDMFLNQLQTGPLTTSGVYFADGWNTTNGPTNLRLTNGQSTANPAPGFPFSLLSTVTSTGAILAAEIFSHQYSIEGTHFRFMGWGAAGAQSLTISLKVRSSIPGTYALAVRNFAGNRSYVTPLVVNVANTWEDKTFVIPGDTGGTWVTGAAGAVAISIGMAIGTTFQTGTPNTWLAGNFLGLTGQTLLTSQINTSTFQITGFQPEPGVVATPFERLPFEVNLPRAMRYFQKSWPYPTANGAAGDISNAYRCLAINANDIIVLSPFPVEFMATPAITIYQPTTGVASTLRRIDSGASVGLSSGMTTGTRAMYSAQATGAVSVGVMYDFQWSGGNRI
jgi:hypothetical protein